MWLFNGIKGYFGIQSMTNCVDCKCALSSGKVRLMPPGLLTCDHMYCFGCFMKAESMCGDCGAPFDVRGQTVKHHDTAIFFKYCGPRIENDRNGIIRFYKGKYVPESFSVGTYPHLNPQVVYCLEAAGFFEALEFMCNEVFKNYKRLTQERFIDTEVREVPGTSAWLRIGTKTNRVGEFGYNNLLVRSGYIMREMTVPDILDTCSINELEAIGADVDAIDKYMKEIWQQSNAKLAIDANTVVKRFKQALAGDDDAELINTLRLLVKDDIGQQSSGTTSLMALKKCITASKAP